MSDLRLVKFSARSDGMLRNLIESKYQKFISRGVIESFHRMMNEVYVVISSEGLVASKHQSTPQIQLRRPRAYEEESTMPSKKMYVKPIEIRETQEYSSEAREPPSEISYGLRKAEKSSSRVGFPAKPLASIISVPAISSFGNRLSGARKPAKCSADTKKPNESSFNGKKSEESSPVKVKSPEKSSIANSKVKKRAAEVRKSKNNQVKGPTKNSDALKKPTAPVSPKTDKPK